MSESRLVIVCTRPGLHRGGLQHPPVATWTAEQLAARGITHAQLTEMVMEPELTLVFGRLVTPADVAGEHGLSLLPTPAVTDAGPNDQGLSHAVQPVAVVSPEGDVLATVATAGGGPVTPVAQPEADALAQAAETVASPLRHGRRAR